MNYFGSKSKISRYIVPIIQKYIDDSGYYYYLESFCGGCNIIDKIRCDRKFAYDLNKYLIYLFIHVKEGGKLPDVITDDQYDQLREAYYNNNVDKKFQNWEIGLLWLSSFNGRGPDGGRSIKGYEKRKDGRIIERNYYQERKRNLLQQVQQPLFQDIIFGISDYRDLDDLKNYVIYCDPPYQNQKQYANSKNFDYTEFWNIMRKWSQNNIVLISEQNAPDDFECIWQQEVTRTIKVTDKRKAVEKLFKYKG